MFQAAHLASVFLLGEGSWQHSKHSLKHRGFAKFNLLIDHNTSLHANCSNSKNQFKPLMCNHTATFLLAVCGMCRCIFSTSKYLKNNYRDPTSNAQYFSLSLLER